MVFNSMNLSAVLAFTSILFGVPMGHTHDTQTCAYFRDAWDHPIPLNICHGQYGGAVESSTSYKFVCSPDGQKVLRYSYIGIDCNGPIINAQAQIDHGFQCEGEPCPYYERFECSGAGCDIWDKNYRCECPTWSTKYYTMNDFNDIHCIGDDKPNDQCTSGNFVKNTCHNQLPNNKYDCYPSTTEYPTKKPSWASPTTTQKPTHWWTTSKPTPQYPTPKPTWKTTTTPKPTPKPTWKTTTGKPTPKPTWRTNSPTKKKTTKYPTGYPTRKPTWKTNSPTKKPIWKTSTKGPTRKPSWTTKKPTKDYGVGLGF